MSILINLEYNFDWLEKFANKENMSLEELGNGVIGESFIVLRSNEKDITVSFVLTGASQKNYYKCIYSDI